MKVLLVSLLIASALCQANLAGLDCEYIPQKLSMQSTLSVNILDDPKRETGCGTEFSAYGTCCSLDSLKTQSTAMNTKVVNAVAMLKTEFDKFSAVVAKIDEWINFAASQNNSPDDPVMSKEAALGKSLNNSKTMKFLRNSFNSTAKGGNFNSSLDKCWGDVSKARSSALCTLCVGRSSGFVFNKNNVVIKDSDCSALAGKCRDSVDNLRIFSQGLTLLINYFQTLLPPTLSIHLDVSRIRRRVLAGMFSVLNSDDITSGLTGSNVIADDKVCKVVLTAGKPTLVEAFASIFNTNSKYAVYDLDASINSKLHNVIARNGFDRATLLSNMTNNVIPLASPNYTDVNAVLATLSTKFNNMAATSRRRRLQTVGDRVQTADFNGMVSELKDAGVNSLNGEFFGMTTTVTPVGAGLPLGSVLDRYLSNDFRMLSETGLRTENGRMTTQYSSPPADNPPTFNKAGMMDPVLVTPISLVIS